MIYESSVNLPVTVYERMGQVDVIEDKSGYKKLIWTQPSDVMVIRIPRIMTTTAEKTGTRRKKGWTKERWGNRCLA